MATFQNCLPDNCVKYSLFPVLNRVNSESSHEQSNDFRQRLAAYIANSYGLISHYLADYIWQNEPFNLRIVSNLEEGESFRDIFAL